MRVTLGGTLYFMHRSKDSNRTPTAPAAAPTYSIYRGDSDSTMTGGTGTMTAVAGSTGLYRAGHSITGGNGYASGNSYTVVVADTVGGVARSEEFTFFVD